MMEKNNRRIVRQKTALTFGGIVLMIIAIVLSAIFLLKGETKVSGEYPNQERSSSLSCSVNNLTYFLFEDTTPLSSTTKVNMVFADDKLASASLIYVAEYENETRAAQAESVMTAKLNDSYGGEFSYNGLGANFSTNKNTSRMSLTANTSEMGSIGRKYFLLGIGQDSQEGYKGQFERQGFNCQANN